ncbi:MAG: Nucleoid occlusion factor SlmA [Alphaproteobacteria bacterium ADurb.BinA280]|jgi:TetR/AcrR family transcriptional regulator|nr:MAG: Nucleoid occlusion factor SlmA [Alphaproteobacteria bacterium ADurb.BinA280]
MIVNAHSKHLPAEERRAATVEAVIQLAAEQNPSQITTAAIAQQMGLSQGALFRHFPTKDDILEAVMRWIADRLLARLDAAANAEISAVGALQAVFTAHIEFVAAHPGVPRLLFGELQQPTPSLTKTMVRTLIQRYGEIVRRLLFQGVAEGDLDARLDVDAAAGLFIGTIQGLVMQSLIAGDTTRVLKDAPGAFFIYLRGVRSTP